MLTLKFCKRKNEDDEFLGESFEHMSQGWSKIC
jgi:hypothetical protein